MDIVFDQKGMHALEARCTQENPPRCQVACPFNLDVRAVMTCLAKGNAREARRLVQRSLPLPGIFAHICDHPCETMCLRESLGGPLNVGEIERFLVREVEAPLERSYVRKKSQRIAIVGAGVAGLVCAHDLAAKGFDVDVYHTGEPEYALKERFPNLDWEASNGPSAEWEKLRAKVAFHKVESLDAGLLEDLSPKYEALFVDASCGEFGISRNACNATSLVYEEGFAGRVVAGGWIGAAFSASRAGGEGRKGALTMERMASGVSLTAARERETRSPAMQLEGIREATRVLPARDGYTKEEAVREASRCLDCRCDICVRACAYMQKYQGYPKVFARRIFNNLSIAQGIRKANTLINSCALCGQCEELCPDGFSMKDLCLAAREELVRQGFMSKSAFEFALEDMEQASGNESFFVHEGNGEKPPKYVFFPGCQLAGARPKQVADVYDFLKDRLCGGVGVYLSCCGIPAHWAGEKECFARHVQQMKEKLASFGSPTVIAACPTCLNVFRDYLPEVASVSLWEVLDGMELASWVRARENTVPDTLVIHDPCAARHNTAWQNAVRSLAKKCGVTVREPKHTRETTACCGHGGNQWCADHEAAKAMARKRAGDLGGPAMVSCIMCRENLASQGLPTWHLLDILPIGEGKMAPYPATSLSQRRAGRIETRRIFVKKLAGEEMPREEHKVRLRFAGTFPLRQNEGVLGEGSRAREAACLAALEARQILLCDVEETIFVCESEGRLFIHPRTGHRLVSHRPRTVTFWVEYFREEDEVGPHYVVHDAWCHRTLVPGAGGEKVNQPRAQSEAGEGCEWLCGRCKKALFQEDVPTRYAHGGLTMRLLRCPKCGLTLVQKDLAEGTMLDMQGRMEETWHGGGQRWMAEEGQ